LHPPPASWIINRSIFSASWITNRSIFSASWIINRLIIAGALGASTWLRAGR
jgi:hypothetical protein